MKEMIVVSAVGRDQPGVAHSVTAAIRRCGGEIAESRMTSLGAEFAMLLLVSGNWHALAKVESELDKLSQRDALSVNVRRTSERPIRDNQIPYLIDVICIRQSDVVEGIAGFFAQRKIDIAELSTHSYAAAHTGSPMLSVQLTVSIPADTSIAALREEFLDFCDGKNLDAVIEPIKN
ncbi:MAG: glycine cleavage system protein R [Gammaproteobacteria bacterium]|nr:glycine cleavage system protein R [Gammaproteobacteria bacterium]